MLDRRRFLAGAATAAIASPFVLRRAWAADPEFTLRLHHLLGPKAPAQVMMLQPFADRILKDSEGRVKIDIYPAMSLGGAPPQLVRQVADGVVDIIWTVNGYTPGLFPPTLSSRTRGLRRALHARPDGRVLALYTVAPLDNAAQWRLPPSQV